MGAVLGKCGRGSLKRKQCDLSTDLFNEGVSAADVGIKVPRHASFHNQLQHSRKPAGTTATIEATTDGCLDESTLVADARATAANLNDSTLIGGDRPNDLLDGSLVDPEPVRWQKGEMIGSGAFGRVYMGMNLASGELLAVKQVLLPREGAQGYAQARAHARGLQAEVAVLRQLRHPNIVRYLGTEKTDTSLNIFLEFVPGGSIASLLSKFGSFTEQVVGMYTRQILEGLEYLHHHRIMHRDIKGANILVDKSGGVKLADFGASKLVHELATISEVAKSIQGTPYWMAPEVIKQTGHGRPADIWSVGCTVIEMATGKPPWSQFQSQLSALFHIASSSAPPDIPDFLSKDARDFVLQCLQRQPSLRPTASQLLEHPFMRRFAQFSRMPHGNADSSFDAVPEREKSFVEHSIAGRGDPSLRDANNALCQVDEANEPMGDFCRLSPAGSLDVDGLNPPRGTESASTGVGSLFDHHEGDMMLFSHNMGSILAHAEDGIDEGLLLGPSQPCWGPRPAPTATPDEILQYLSVKVEEDEKRLLAPLALWEPARGHDDTLDYSPPQRASSQRQQRDPNVAQLMCSLEADQSLLSLSRACTDESQHEEGICRVPSTGPRLKTTTSGAAAAIGSSSGRSSNGHGAFALAEPDEVNGQRCIDIRAEPGPAWLLDSSSYSDRAPGGELASAGDVSGASRGSRGSRDTSRDSDGLRRGTLSSGGRMAIAGAQGPPLMHGWPHRGGLENVADGGIRVKAGGRGGELLGLRELPLACCLPPPRRPHEVVQPSRFTAKAPRQRPRMTVSARRSNGKTTSGKSSPCSEPKGFSHYGELQVGNWVSHVGMYSIMHLRPCVWHAYTHRLQLPLHS
eukprot:jgi/Mesvir1/12580/Mv10329-RA.1